MGVRMGLWMGRGLYSMVRLSWSLHEVRWVLGAFRLLLSICGICGYPFAFAQVIHWVGLDSVGAQHLFCSSQGLVFDYERVVEYSINN